MFDRLRSWFNDLSRAKKAAAVVVAVATGVGAMVGAVSGSIDLYEKLTERQSAANPLELVDVDFSQRKQPPSNMREIAAALGYSPREYCAKYESACSVSALDFKVANSDDDPVIIKRADLQVKKIWTFKAPYDYNPRACQYLYLAPSYDYAVRLPIRESPYTVSESLSQSIGPGETDRFTITPYREERTAESGEDYVFLFMVSLVYGADNKVVTSEDILYGELDAELRVFYSYHPGECMTVKKGLDSSDLARLTRQNERAITEIKRTEAMENASLEELLREVS